LMRACPQRQHTLGELFNRLQWRYVSHDLPPWHAVYQRTRRWIDAELVADERALIRFG